MKKLLCIAFAVAALASCKKDDKTVVNRFDVNAVHLSPTTLHPGRAAEETLLTMEADANGFEVYAWDGDGTGWWNGVAGISHKFADGAWNFDPPIEWPVINSPDFPLHFAAIYPGSGLLVVDPATHSLTFSPTVASERDNQTDYLIGRTHATIKPTSGNLSMTFHHIMSKINFGIKMPVGYQANVQGVRINNVGNTGKYDLSGTSTLWTVSPTVFASGYDYYGHVLLAAGGVNELPSPAIVGIGANEPFFNATTTPTAANAHLMLMPQNAPTPARLWGGGSAPTALPTAADSYISAVYRLQDASANDLVGFAEAGSHPDFVGSYLQGTGYSSTDPLFIKVGFPFTLAWDAGKGYTYNIILDNTTGTSSGGYLIDEYYYDNIGNPTDLRVDAVVPGATVPDPIFGDGYIHLVPDVQDWDEEPSEGL